LLRTFTWLSGSVVNPVSSSPISPGVTIYTSALQGSREPLVSGLAQGQQHEDSGRSSAQHEMRPPNAGRHSMTYTR
jgi:hypothetical protein